jgi:hypothetical protein
MASAFAAFQLALPNFAQLMLMSIVEKLPRLKRLSHASITLYTSPKPVDEASFLSISYVFASEADTLGPCALYCPFPQAV